MKRILSGVVTMVIVIGMFNCSGGTSSDGDIISIPDYRQPRSYICFNATGELLIDGQLTDAEWGEIPWSEYFGDIEGDIRPDPLYKTRMKMMWDEEYLYVAAELEEPHVWANLRQRDTVIFYDNDFEVFIDPDGDTHSYYELEINAFGTEWDLMLIQPYRDGGPAVNSWDIQGLKVGVDIQGTINNPGDTDQGWTVEMAIPFATLIECAPGGKLPLAGDQWRINFSRVEWKVQAKNDRYEKVINPETNKPFPENNWIWSPQGYINMHMPEYWGYVQFAGSVDESGVTFKEPEGTESRWILRNLYYRQFKYNEEKGEYASSLEDLSWPVDSLKEISKEVILESGKYGYQAYIESNEPDGKFVINERGRIVKK